MAVLTEGKHRGEAIISEANGSRSREKITINTGQNLVPMTVLGKITASGKYEILDPAAVDGTEAAAAILVDAVNALAADGAGAGLLRDCEVFEPELQWPAGISAGEKTTAIGELAALGIVVRS